MKYLNKIFLFIICSNTYSQCINLKGIVYSQNNNQALESKIEVRVNGQKKNIGKTNIDGKFEIEIPCDAQSLILTKKDFRNLEIPIKNGNIQGLFYVKIPLIPLDKEISDKPYAQSEQSDIVLNNVASINTKTAPRIFKIVDATTKQTLTGKVCLFYTKSGEKKCLDTDKSNNPKVVFQEEDIVAIEADSKGFQSYIGNIVVNKLDNQVSVYEIALSKTPIIFVAKIQEIETNTVQNIDLLSPDLKKNKIEQSQNQFYSFLEKTGQYSYTIKTKNQVIENKVIIDFGINFVKIIEPPKQQPPPIFTTPTTNTATKETLLFNDIEYIYFDQSDYFLTKFAKQKLDTVSMVLKHNETFTVQIEGHTDNVGDPRINETLGEYRARVTYQYLLKLGIDSKRLTWVSYGGSKPTTSNDNENNKKKNRRVEIIYKKN